MWNQRRLIGNGFLIGLIVEYTVRVGFSIWSIIIGLLILATVIIEFIYDEQNVDKKRVIPEGWEIHDYGQHMNKCWYISLIRSRDINDIGVKYAKMHLVVDKASYDEALEDVISKI